jgi:hypothetical protein
MQGYCILLTVSSAPVGRRGGEFRAAFQSLSVNSVSHIFNEFHIFRGEGWLNIWSISRSFALSCSVGLPSQLLSTIYSASRVFWVQFER